MVWVTRHQDCFCSLGIEPFSTSVTYMCMYIYICIYIYVYIFVCSMPHIGVWSTCMGYACAHVYVFSCAVRACKHVLRVREGSRNGCGICQACLRQASAVGGKKSLGSWGFFYFLRELGVYVGVCVCIRIHTHKLHRWGTWMWAQGSEGTPGGPEESRWTKSRHICISYMCTRPVWKVERCREVWHARKGAE